MSYSGVPYAGGSFAGESVAAGGANNEPIIAVDVAFTTGALETPVWEPVTADVRRWNVNRGRRRELERFQPGRATVVLDNRLRKYDSALGAPAQYIDLPGTSGNYASTPDSAAASITGDIDIRVKLAMDDWTPAADGFPLIKEQSTTLRSYGLGINTSGQLFIRLSLDGSTALQSQASTSAVPFSNGATGWIRGTRASATGSCNFYTSTDGETWALLGTANRTSTAGALHDNASQVEVGGRFNGTANLIAGNVYYAEVRNGIDGPAVVVFDPNTVLSTGTRTPSSWTSTTGETWTVNGSAWAWGGSWGTPYSGNIKPMRRIRIRETFNGVTYPTFDGFVDKWVLDYQHTGKDATATVTATERPKIDARTDLPRSVYEYEVSQDSPAIWYHLDEAQADASTTVINVGSLGAAADGTYMGPPKTKGAQGLIFHDPGTSIETVDGDGLITPVNMGVKIAETDFDLNGFGSWAIEFWVRPTDFPSGVDYWLSGSDGAFTVQADSAGEDWTFLLVNNSLTLFGVTGNAAGHNPNTRYHVVAKFGPNKAMAIYVNGTKYTTTSSGASAPPLTGTIFGIGDLGFLWDATDNAQSPATFGDEFAVYTAAAAVDPLSDARVTAHYNAGVAPWNADQPEDRADRILDIVGWPADLRELDAGNVEFQSAALGVTALEHLQKVAETEFGLLFTTRDGKVRLVSRASQFARTPAPQVLGDADDGVEVPYRDIKFDDGDSVIRNRATIGQLNGVPAVSESTASVDEYGRFDYNLSDLLHDSLTYGSSYADFIVAEYKDPRRRIVSLDLGPAKADTGVYEQILGRELGDAVTIRNRPLPASSTVFEQVSVIEGVEHDWQPKVRTARWTLSPEFSTSF